MSLPQTIQQAHDDASSRGEAMYQDPRTGLWVMTAHYLKARGYCCESGCRHCPYPPAEEVRPRS